MTMEVEDLRNKMKDIQCFKISREVQRVSRLKLEI